MSREKILEEIELIRSRSEDGAINPVDVVAFAQNPKTALHGEFTWDDTKAAAEYRLWQARQILRVCVYYEPSVEQTIRAFVSLPEDRGTETGGYRRTPDVARNAAHRAAMLVMALRELEFFQQKYAVLSELAQVFDAAAAVKNRSKKKTTRGATAKSAARATKGK